MKRLMLFFVLCTAVFCSSCKPINGPEGGEQGETPIDTIVIGDTVWDNSALIGEWQPYNYDNNDPEIWCRYTNFRNVLHLERLFFIETHPSRYAYCKYSINGDTLHIENFSMTIAAVYPPMFSDVTLIRKKN